VDNQTALAIVRNNSYEGYILSGSFLTIEGSENINLEISDITIKDVFQESNVGLISIATRGFSHINNVTLIGGYTTSLLSITRGSQIIEKYRLLILWASLNRVSLVSFKHNSVMIRKYAKSMLPTQASLIVRK